MARIQEPLVIQGNTLKNRIVMEPMYTFSFTGDDGFFYGQQHVAHYEQRAKGGAGLIIIQATHCAGASDGTGQWTAHDRQVLKSMAERCHTYGCAVMMQLAFGDIEINGLSADDIRAMQKEMVCAAVTACELGYDGAEFHFAHGFTLCKFIDASYNKRTDAYGGDVAGRVKILTEILPDIRKNIHKKFIVGVRMGEYLPESKDGVETAQAFEKAGIDLLNVSFGPKFPEGPVPDGFICSPMAYSGCHLKQAVDIPVIAAGGLRTEEQVRFLIENDYVDLAGIGTAFLADPEFAGHLLRGEPFNKCHGCARCLWFKDHTKCPART
jgi:NADPH2 dehydrogenase